MTDNLPEPVEPGGLPGDDPYDRLGFLLADITVELRAINQRQARWEANAAELYKQVAELVDRSIETAERVEPAVQAMLRSPLIQRLMRFG